jgi:hypothetical protein
VRTEAEQPCQNLNIGVSYFTCYETWISSIEARCTTSQIAAFAISFLPLPDSPHRLFQRISDIEALFKTG